MQTFQVESKIEEILMVLEFKEQNIAIYTALKDLDE